MKFSYNISNSVASNFKLAASFVALLLIASLMGQYVPLKHAPFASNELRFADASMSGLQIVPASCPSSPHNDGQCDVPPQPPTNGCVLVAEPEQFYSIATPKLASYTGSANFPVPVHSGDIVAELWGGGGGGGGDGSGDGDGVDGGNSIFNAPGNSDPTATGGEGGIQGSGTNAGTGGAGGTGTNGDVSMQGNAGGNAFAGASTSGAGGSAPLAGSAGAGGAAVSPGTAGRGGFNPGGGGSGGALTTAPFGGGGGSGGYVKKTYSEGELVAGSNIAITIGSGGTAGTGSQAGGSGAWGGARISWNEPPSVVLAWNSRGMSNLSISPTVGSVSSSGSLTVYITEPTTFSILSNGVPCDDVEVTLGEGLPPNWMSEGGCQGVSCVDFLDPPEVTFWAQPSLVRIGETTTLHWSAENVTSCHVVQNPEWQSTGDVTNISTSTPPINSQTTYTLSCTGQDTTVVNRNTTVNIIPIFEEQ